MMLAFIFPPIRQRKTVYFSYFLILALSDPINLAILYLLKINPHTFYTIPMVFIYQSLANKGDLKKNLIPSIIVALILFAVAQFLPATVVPLLIFILSLAVAFQVLKITIRSSYNTMEINLFHFMLVLYQLTILIKFLLWSSGNEGIISFYVMNGFSAIIAIYFSIFTEEKPLLKIPLTPKKT